MAPNCLGPVVVIIHLSAVIESVMVSHRQSRILIVDDNPANLKVLFDVLQAAGHRVLVAKSGEIALEALQEVTPDLILLDVLMPGLDGFEICRRLKANETTQQIPIIFMTVLTDAIDRLQGLRLGAADYITKPFQYEEALTQINTHLKLQSVSQDLMEIQRHLGWE